MALWGERKSPASAHSFATRLAARRAMSGCSRRGTGRDFVTRYLMESALYLSNAPGTVGSSTSPYP